MRKSLATTSPAKSSAAARQRTNRHPNRPAEKAVNGPSIVSLPSPRYWQWSDPPGSDYQHAHVNGRIHHPFRLPFVECETCGSAVSHFYDIVLPIECSQAFRSHPHLGNPDVFLSVRELGQLVKSMDLLGRGPFHARAWAGACLQPGFLDVPSVPKADVLWSSLQSGLSSIVVSTRVRRTIESMDSPGLAFYPLVPGKIGKRSPKSRARIPKSGEPEDILESYHASQSPPGLDGYSQLLISAESLTPPGAEARSRCPTCGEEEQPDWNARDQAWRQLTADRIASLAPDLALFRIPERGTIIVADRLKDALEKLGATNVAFKPFPPEPSNQPRRKSKLG